jgi:hypothetical protein
MSFWSKTFTVEHFEKKIETNWKWLVKIYGFGEIFE